MIISQDGIYKLPSSRAGISTDKTIVLVSGKFGSAKATLVYSNSNKEPIPFIDGELVSGGQYIVYDGGAIVISILVSGAVEGVTAIDIISEGIS